MRALGGAMGEVLDGFRRDLVQWVASNYDPDGDAQDQCDAALAEVVDTASSDLKRRAHEEVLALAFSLADHDEDADEAVAAWVLNLPFEENNEEAHAQRFFITHEEDDSLGLAVDRLHSWLVWAKGSIGDAITSFGNLRDEMGGTEE